MVFLSKLAIGNQAVAALHSILSSKQTPIDHAAEGDAREKVIQPSQAARILAEMRTRYFFI